MSTRTISTRLAIDGEAEYRQAIQQCNSELANHKSQIALVSSEYQTNANTMEALQAKQDALTQRYDAQQNKVNTLREALANAEAAHQGYIDKMESLKGQLSDAESEMERLRSSSGNTAAEQAVLTDEINRLNAELAQTEQYANAAQTGVDSWQRQVNYAQADLNKMSAELEQNSKYLNEAKDSAGGCATSIDKFGKEAGDTGNVLEDFAAKAAELFTLAGLVGLATELGKALYELATQVQEAEAIIVKATGATGQALDDLSASAQKIYAQVYDSDMANTAAAVGEINTRLGLTGDELERVTVLFSEYARVNNTDVVGAVNNVTKIMKNWGVGVADTGGLMDRLTVAAQASGISVDTLSGYLVTNKVQLQQLGYSLDESIALFAMMEKEGINSSQVLMGFRQAVTNISNAGGDAKKELRSIIAEIKGMGNESDATALAIKVFGTRAGQELAYAIRSGRFEIEDWVSTVVSAEGALDATAEASLTFGDKWVKAVNSLKSNVALLGAEIDRATGKMLDDLTQSSRALDDLADAYTGTADDIEATALVAGRYLSHLKELETQGLNTAEAQDEYARTISTLNALMPDLNIQIDEQTGLIVGNTDAIIDNIEAWKKTAVLQAGEEQLKGSAKASADGILVLENNQTKLTDAQLKAAGMEAQKDLTYQKLADALGMTTKELGGYTAAQLHALATADKNDKGAKNLLDTYKGLANELYYADRDVQLYTDAVRDNEDAIADLTATLDGYGDALQAADDATAEQSETLSAAAEDFRQLADEVKSLEEAYQTAHQAAYESISGQISLLSEMDNSAKTSAQTINEALESQITYLSNYTTNLEGLASRQIEGVDRLAAALSDGSTASAAALAGLADASDEEIAEIIRNMDKVETGKDNFARTIAQMQTDFDDEMTAIEKRLGIAIGNMEMTDDAAWAARNTVQGYINGAKAMLREVEDTFRELARAGEKALNKSLEIQSPSRVMMRAGEYTMQGYVDGLRSKARVIEDAMRETARAEAEIMAANADRLRVATIIPERIAVRNLQTVVNNAYTQSPVINIYPRSIDAATMSWIEGELNKSFGRRIQQ